jgi:hypothetical protein
MKLETAQPLVKTTLPLLVLLAIPLTVWIAVAFRDPSIRAYSARNADFNLDQKVDENDLQLFTEEYLSGDSAADINADGRVDSADFEIIRKFFPQN